MKFNSFITCIKTLAVAGVCFSLIACEKNGDNHNNGGNGDTSDDETAVIGEYTGTMDILEVTASEDENTGEETPSGTEISASVTADAIEFADFPVRDLIVKILGSDETADAIIEAIGPISYSIPYEASLSEDETAVNLTLAPENMTIKLPVASTMSESEEDGSMAIEVEITADSASESVYDIQSENLSFIISVASIKIGDTPMDGFAAFSLDFDMTKK